jgi:radical SAM-linked protein
VQRLRVRFHRLKELKYISHLDIMRMWQRAFRRADITLAYSEGFNPQPRISLAAPLAIGVTSQAELMDAYLSRWVSPHNLTVAVNRQLPPGIEILQVSPVPLTQPSLQSLVRFAEYIVEVSSRKDEQEVRQALDELLARDKLPWQHSRDTGPRHYDLRRLVDGLSLAGCAEGRCVINMRLRCDSSGSGRPEQVALALGFESPLYIHRTRLILKAG